eukprot:292334-Pleurochrysis_carterae.AAC.1
MMCTQESATDCAERGWLLCGVEQVHYSSSGESALHERCSPGCLLRGTSCSGVCDLGNMALSMSRPRSAVPQAGRESDCRNAR